MIPRSSGVFAHITSLPSPFACGVLGAGARAFVDFLAEGTQRYWQILPLVPVDSFGSPYCSASAFAGEIMLIDPQTLLEQGLLEPGELPYRDSPDAADLPFARAAHTECLRKACARFQGGPDFDAFCEREAAWLEPYALFSALKARFDGAAIWDWPEPLRRREPEAMAQALLDNEQELHFVRFCQFQFQQQWLSLKDYANRKGVRIIGDIPFYVSGDSAEVWAEPRLFVVDEDLRAKERAGVPPDAFCADGQLWGNPLYRWDVQAGEGFAWWKRRISRCAALYDVLRIDHFRAFCNYWSVPAGAETAINGRWEQGPGLPLLEVLQQAAPGLDLIAEDLGDLDAAARHFVQASGLPGMRVLVQAFDGDYESSFLPHNCEKNSVIYVSTHDTDTFMGWWDAASPRQQAAAGAYLRLRMEEGFNWGAIKAAMACAARLCIVPLQDVLGLHSDARMNRPGVAQGNWSWRVRAEGLNADVAALLRSVSGIYWR